MLEVNFCSSFIPSLDFCLMSSTVYFRDTKEQLIKEGGHCAPGSMCSHPFFFYPLPLGPSPTKLYGSKFLIDVRFNFSFGIMAVGLVIEEITEEIENVPSGNNRSSSSEQIFDQPKKSGDSKSYNIANNGNLKSNSDSIDTLKKDPEAIR